MNNEPHPHLASAHAESERLLERFTKYEGEDDHHMAIALLLIQKAIAMKQCKGNMGPMIHASLRDAALHCECARKYWSNEAAAERQEITRRLFGDDKQEHP